jgi:hypothetical protein
MEHDDHVVLGTRDSWSQEIPASLSRADRRHHMYAIGKSGTGKTTLLRNLILQDIEAGRGVGVIDPHGDLAFDLLEHIPKFRTEDVVYFDPSDPEHSVAFNLLARVPAERRHLVASGIVGAFKGIFPEFFGPRMEFVFYAAVAALLECENVSLLCLQRMLSDERYRAWVTRQVKDPMVRYFWQRDFEPRDKKAKAEMVSPILNKIGPMLMAPQLRRILGQVGTRIDARFMMDSRRIFIANLSKGRLGTEGANLLGSFLVAQFQLAAMSRVDIPEHEREDFFLYVDEFQSFVSDSFTSILAEARKYRLCLTLSHQYFDQLKPNISAAVFGNVGSIVAFRVGHRDAEALELAFGKSYAASAFTSLNNGEVYAKLLSNGRDLDAFLARTLPPQGRRHGRSEKIIRRSREKYSVCSNEVEDKIRRWLESRKRLGDSAWNS